MALEIDHNGEVGLEYSDNITRTDINPISQTTSILLLNANINHQSPNIALNIDPRITYRNYAGDTFDNQTFIGLDATLLWDMLPQQFSWSFEDYLDQEAVNVLVPDTPFNRQNTNIFLTGPDLTVHFGTGRRLEVLLRYADIYYEISNADNTRYGTLFRIISEPNISTTYSFNMDFVDVAYEDNISNDDYTRNEAYLVFEKESLNKKYHFEAGYTQINMDRSPYLDYPLFRLLFDYQISTNSTISLDAHTQLTDSSRNFLLSRALRDGTRRFNTSITGFVFKENSISGNYRWQKETIGAGIGLSASEQDYNDTDPELTRDIYYLNIDFNKYLSALMNIYARGIFQNTDYKNTGRIDENSTYRVGLLYNISRSLYLRIQAEKNSQNSTDQTYNYDENVAYISIGYRRQH